MDLSHLGIAVAVFIIGYLMCRFGIGVKRNGDD